MTALLSDRLQEYYSDIGEPQPAPSRISDQTAESLAEWLRIDAQLCDWLRDPSEIVDADAIAPSHDLIRMARQIVRRFQVQGLQIPPSMVVPDSNGGIAMEWHHGGIFRLIEILTKGETRLTEFSDGHRRFSMQLEWP